jgi:D-amino-acid dehydrogenase
LKIIVLGAGVVGVSAAWYLADAGHEVTVLERREAPGLETSFANGGQISASHAEPWAKPSVLPKLLTWLGREDAPFLFRPRADLAQWEWGLRFLLECAPGRFERSAAVLAGLAAYSRDCLRALVERTGIRYDRLSRGILHFCTDERDFEALARHAEAMRALGVHREIKSAAECAVIEPALARSQIRIVGGAYAPQDESGDAGKFTQQLAALCRQRGVLIRTGVHVTALESEGTEISALRASAAGREERVTADAYVVALGSYSPLLLAPLGLRIPVYPLKGYSITLPLDAKAETAAPCVSLTDEAHKLVISRLGNRLRAAGTAELAGYDTSVNAVRCRAIAGRVGKLFPALAAVPPVEQWAGLRPATPTNVPLVGRTRLRNLFLNTGHGTLGWTLACGSGRALADLVSARRPEVSFRFLNA